MKIFSAALMLGLSCLVQAEEFQPDLSRYVSPAFPSGLRGGKLIGEAKISYRIHNDGSVSDIKVVSKTNHKFSSAVVYAISRWRFIPWDIADEKPASVQESVEYLFGVDRIERRLKMIMVRQGE